jgi:hypothetical protein
MKRINFQVTIEELRLLASLASDQLFRRQFIDPRMPGYKGSPEEVNLGKVLVGRMKLVIDEGYQAYFISSGAELALETTGDPMKNIRVGNLNSGTTPETIRSLFEPFGAVRKFRLMMDGKTGLPRGFAFVEMTEVDEPGPVIAALNGRIVDGQTIEVREGRPKLHRLGSPGRETHDPPATRL